MTTIDKIQEGDRILVQFNGEPPIEGIAMIVSPVSGSETRNRITVMRGNDPYDTFNAYTEDEIWTIAKI